MRRSNRRVIIDTNVLISFLLNVESLPGQAVKHVLLHDTTLLSDDTEKELFRKLLNPKFDRYVSLETRMEFFDTFVYRSEKAHPDIAVSDCRDPEDNKFLELAISANADCIITGDKDLLALNPYRSVPIITPKDFLGKATLPEITDLPDSSQTD